MNTTSTTRMLNDHRIIIVGGSGGVGKTSVSAAVAIKCALAGYKTLVLTIDPARRLAGALGLDGIGTEAVEVTPRLKAVGLEVKGQLFAMMLDVQNTLDRLVDQYAASPQAKQEILNNRLYQNISTRLTGSQEYASMQRLYEIANEGVYDRIILDTPPSTHALDFLTAPKRLLEFFDSKIMHAFISVGGKAGRGFFRVTDVFFRALERLTGSGLIHEIAEFFKIAQAILEPFQSQGAQADALLRRSDVTFFIVSGPHHHQLDDASEFSQKLSQMGIKVSGMLVNRWLAQVAPQQQLSEAPDLSTLEHRVQTWAARLEAVARRQDEAIRSVEAKHNQTLTRIPVFDGDIHSIEGLLQIVYLLG